MCLLLKYTQQAPGLMLMVPMESTCQPTSSHARVNPLFPHNQATTTSAAAPIAPVIPTPAPILTVPTAPPVAAAPLPVAVPDPDNAPVAELSALTYRLVADSSTLFKLLSAAVAWLPALPALLAKELTSPTMLLAAAVTSETADPAAEAIEGPAARASEAAEVAGAMTDPTELMTELMSGICGKASGLALAFGFARLKGRRIATKATVAKFVVRMLTVGCGMGEIVGSIDVIVLAEV